MALFSSHFCDSGVSFCKSRVGMLTGGAKLFNMLMSAGQLAGHVCKLPQLKHFVPIGPPSLLVAGSPMEPSGFACRRVLCFWGMASAHCEQVCDQCVSNSRSSRTTQLPCPLNRAQHAGGLVDRLLVLSGWHGVRHHACSSLHIGFAILHHAGAQGDA